MEKLMTTLIRRRWLMVTIFVLLSGLGIYAWRHLAIDAYPDIAEVTVGVVTQVPGLAAEEIEQQITIPIERELNGIPKMKMIRYVVTYSGRDDVACRDGARPVSTTKTIQQSSVRKHLHRNTTDAALVELCRAVGIWDVEF